MWDEAGVKAEDGEGMKVVKGDCEGEYGPSDLQPP